MKKTTTPGAMRANRAVRLARERRDRHIKAVKIKRNLSAAQWGDEIPYPELMSPAELEFAGTLREAIQRSRAEGAMHEARRREEAKAREERSFWRWLR